MTMTMSRKPRQHASGQQLQHHPVRLCLTARRVEFSIFRHFDKSNYEATSWTAACGNPPPVSNHTNTYLLPLAHAEDAQLLRIRDLLPRRLDLHIELSVLCLPQNLLGGDLNRRRSAILRLHIAIRRHRDPGARQQARGCPFERRLRGPAILCLARLWIERLEGRGCFLWGPV